GRAGGPAFDRAAGLCPRSRLPTDQAADRGGARPDQRPVETDQRPVRPDRRSRGPAVNFWSLPTRKAQLMAASSGLSLLMLAVPGHAQGPAAAEADPDARGARLDHSDVRRAAVAPNVEREGAEFGGL